MLLSVKEDLSQVFKWKVYWRLTWKYDLSKLRKKKSPCQHETMTYFCDKCSKQRFSFPCINKEEPIEPYPSDIGWTLLREVRCIPEEKPLCNPLPFLTFIPLIKPQDTTDLKLWQKYRNQETSDKEMAHHLLLSSPELQVCLCKTQLWHRGSGASDMAEGRGCQCLGRRVMDIMVLVMKLQDGTLSASQPHRSGWNCSKQIHAGRIDLYCQSSEFL